jgi:hypothetical protein
MIKIWVIYERPKDFPDQFVMREHHIKGGKNGGPNEVRPTEHFYTADSIAELRRKVPAGKQRIERIEGDEPQIVEWWF